MDCYAVFVFHEGRWYIVGLFDYLMQAEKVQEDIEHWAERFEKDVEFLTIALPAPASKPEDVDAEFANMLKNFGPK
jgi:hypothetical protein